MDEVVKVYWQPGCSSCLKTKEFLETNNIKFESINILEDPRGFKDLEKFGLRMVPIVIKGENWANGAVFRDVAKVLDVPPVCPSKLNDVAVTSPVILNVDAVVNLFA